MMGLVGWTRVAYEYEHYRGTMGSFHRAICDAIVHADQENLDRLRLGFPQLVALLKGES